MRYEYEDVSDRADLAAPHPEVVAAFEAHGWSIVGRYTLSFSERDTGRILAGYAQPARSELAAHLPDVATVLLSPDRSTAAYVSWFWDGPAVRLASLLPDGGLVETVRLWTDKPAWPRGLRSGWAGMDLREEIERSSVPRGGRSVRAAAMGDPSRPDEVARLVDAHRRHVAQCLGGDGASRDDASSTASATRPAATRGQETAPTALPFGSLEDAIDLRRKAFAHDLRVRQRMVLALLGVVLATAVVLGVLSGLLHPGRISPLVLVGECVLLLLGLHLVQGRLVRRLTYVRWFRPAYR